MPTRALKRRQDETKRRLFMVTSLIVALLAMTLLALCVGRYEASFTQCMQALFASHTDAYDPLINIVQDVRLPRILMAIVVGAGLACAGTAFQALFANPLAAPDTLGVATGSAFGAVLGILLNTNALLIQTSSLVFGLVAMALVMMVSHTRHTKSVLMLILSGMVVSALFTALISLMKIVADPQDQLPGIVYWIMGSLTGATWKSFELGVAPIVLGTFILWLLRWRLNVLTLPDHEAKSLGIPLQSTRWIVIVASTLITASAVSMTGLIGWIGLIIPHAARLLVGGDNRRVLTTSMLLGALFLLVVDTLARSVSNAEIPVAVLTSLIGAPLFLWLLAKKLGGQR